MPIMNNMPDAEYRSLYRNHLSVSCWRRWMRCGAAEWERLAGTWTDPEKDPAKDPLLIGQFAHVAMLQPELLPDWLAAHSGIILKSGANKGHPGEKYQEALRIVEKIKSAAGAERFLSCKREVTITGEIDGVKWCGRIDMLDIKNRRFWDFKTTASFADYWNGKEKVPWYAEYWPQIAVYGELLSQALPGETPWIGGLVAGTKQNPPAIGAWEMSDPYKLAIALSSVTETQGQVVAWREGLKSGKPENFPTACGDLENCEYCREYTALDVKEAK
jgi:hypothetical protein